MLQQFGRYKRNGQQTIVLIIVKRKHILLDSIDELEGSDFFYLQSPIEIINKLKIQEIIFKLYENNL